MIRRIAVIRAGRRYLIRLDYLETFLRTCYRRQENGEAPFSRKYWCRKQKMNNSQYTAYLQLLEDCDVLFGRKPGNSGTMAFEPAEAMRIIEERHEVE